MNLRRFWIRSDREVYFLGGVIIACAIGGFVSTYWHYTDRISVRRNIKIQTGAPTEQRQKKLRDTQYIPSKTRVGKKQYYRMEESIVPSIPKPGEEDDE